MKLNFYLRDGTSKSETPILLFARSGKSEKGSVNTIKIATGLKIRPRDWNSNAKAPRRGINNESLINQRLSQVKLIAIEIWTKLIYENPKVSLQEYKEVLKENIQTPVTKQISQSSKSTIFEYLFQFIESISNERSISTIEKYKNLHRLLLTYSDRLTFENIDLSFFDSIKSHWLKENSLSNTTINKNIKLLKTFLSWAFDRKITDNDEFKRFKPMKQHDLNIVALTKAEFDAIYELKIMSSHLARVRDVFCFACLTGQRWSDIYKIDRDEIIDSTWSITQEKSKKKIRVPLLPQALAILKKYKDDEQPLPIISGQKTNQHLKEIGKLAGLNEIISIEVLRGSETQKTKRTKSDLLTTHVARKSFITISFALGMNPSDVMAITGHTTYAAMKPYILVTEDQKRNSLINAWQKK